MISLWKIFLVKIVNPYIVRRKQILLFLLFSCLSTRIICLCAKVVAMELLILAMCNINFVSIIERNKEKN